MRKSFSALWILISLVALLIWLRATHELQNQQGVAPHQWSNDFSPVKDTVLSGYLPGLVADFIVLDVFSIYYDAKVEQHQEEMQYLNVYLKRAQNLDPMFNDVYRLAESILAMDAGQPKEAVELLAKGAVVLTDNWEVPFFGGFIAGQYVGDNKKAFALMSMVIGRPKAPYMAISLANKFLSRLNTKEDAIIFLQGLLSTMPEAYQGGIKEMMAKLKAEMEAESKTAIEPDNHE